jgi:hypothetical protein
LLVLIKDKLLGFDRNKNNFEEQDQAEAMETNPQIKQRT